MVVKLYKSQGLDVPAPVVAVVGLGKQSRDPADQAESARNAAASALSSLRSLSKKANLVVDFDDLGNARAAAEGAVLGTYHINELKDSESRPGPVTVSSYQSSSDEEWKFGAVMAEAQNLARKLAETPANHLTPTIFADQASSLLTGIPRVEVNIHDKAWAEKEKMNAFLSVASGSDEPLRFVEIIYRGGEGTGKVDCVGLVGKGVTFDSGGISLKPSTDMAMMKGDMGGAAAVLGAMWAITKLQLPVNVVAVMPLTENMPSGRATKPGDVVTARNGKTIEIDNTDAEGRLILADALHYVSVKHKPTHILELSTLTGAMDVALGGVFAGVFTNSTSLFADLKKAGEMAGDEFWRMPLDKRYRKQMESNVADLRNVGGRSAGACTAAIFLSEFVDGYKEDGSGVQFAHIDIAGVMHNKGPDGYLGKGMTGRPTRSIVEYVMMRTRKDSDLVFWVAILIWFFVLTDSD
ncbi:hypothetical protein HK104_003365 [Borealophlyctis nickersoniae]|nr:hypothetical protein HK104_003365 [Borealophlyctis nickersoniae]